MKFSLSTPSRSARPLAGVTTLAAGFALALFLLGSGPFPLPLAPSSAHAAEPGPAPGAARPASTAGLTSTPMNTDGQPLTNTLINCQNGSSYLSTNAVFRGSVRVFDPNLYLECELLTVYFPSNNAVGTLRSEATPAVGNITAIVAQTNVLVMLRGATIIGDRAVYWATNDIIQITGGIVVIETDSGYAYGTNFIFNRRSMELQSIGPSTLESKPGINLIQGTNGGSISPFGPGATRPRKPAAAPGGADPAGQSPNP